MRGAFTKAGIQVKARNRPAGSLQRVLVVAHDNAGHVKFLDNARGDNAYDAGMPLLAVENQAAVRVLGQMPGSLFAGFGKNNVLSVAPVIVQIVKPVCQRLAFFKTAAAQKLHGYSGMMHASCRIDAGGQLEADIGRCDCGIGMKP